MRTNEQIAREAAERWFSDDGDLSAYGYCVRNDGIRALSEVILSAIKEATKT